MTTEPMGRQVPSASRDTLGRMRLLHTADWHLGRPFHGESLLDAQAGMIGHLADVAREHAVDAILVAGDLYDRALPPVEAVRLADDALARLSEICLALPEARAEASGRHVTFRVRGKVFAYYLDDHHGDGIVGVVGRAPGGENEALIAADPDRWYMPAYVGPRGWVGRRLDVAGVDWEDVVGFVSDSYLLAAPKRLAASVRRD